MNYHSVSKIASQSVEIFKKNWTTFVGFVLASIIVNVLTNIADDKSLLGIILMIVGLVINYALVATITLYTLHIIDNKKTSVASIIDKLSIITILRVLIASILSGIICAISFLLLIIPFFFIAPRLFGIIPAILEGKTIKEAFSFSFKISKNQKWFIWKAILLSIVIVIAGLICLIIGVIPAAAIVIILKVKAYTILRDDYKMSLIEAQPEE